MHLSIEPLSAERRPALDDLFGRPGASNGCWCMYWRLGPRYHERPRDLNREARHRLAETQPAPGLLAFEDDRPVGWCELAPRADLDWLGQVSHLRPVDDLPVWSIPCFYVRRSRRGRGVMGALIDAAVHRAASFGAPALEAYPIDTSVPGHARNLFPGVASVFAARGFHVVAAHKPDRPIMRRRLDYPRPDVRP